LPPCRKHLQARPIRVILAWVLHVSVPGGNPTMKHLAERHLTGSKAVLLVVLIWAVGFPSMLWALRHVLT